MSLKNVRDLVNQTQPGAHWIGVDPACQEGDTTRMIVINSDGFIEYSGPVIPGLLEPHEQDPQRQEDHSNSKKQSL